MSRAMHFTTDEANLGWGALFATLVCTMLQWLPYLCYRDRHPKGALPDAGSPRSAIKIAFRLPRSL